MGRFFLIIILNILFLSSDAYSETAILPYRIENPSVDFSLKAGFEYSQILGVAARIKKGISIYSNREMGLVLKKLSINAQSVVTKETLNIFGKGGYIDFIILGSLSRARGLYISDSILYSVKHKRIEAKCRSSADDYYHLAEKDIDNLFLNFSDKIGSNNPKSILDITILIDISYNVLKNWDSIKAGLVNLSRLVFDEMSIDTSMNLVPFADSYSFDECHLSINSVHKIKGVLNELRLRGGNTVKDFEKAFSDSINNIRWRDDSSKILIIVSNSPLEEGQFMERYALNARKRGIGVYTFSSGHQSHGDREFFKQLSVIGEGKHFSVSYHQRVFDVKGRGVDIYMEDGFLFYSRVYSNEWRYGLFEPVTNGGFDYRGKPRLNLKEIFFDKSKYSVNPYNMIKFLPQFVEMDVINSRKVEDNIDVLFERICDSFLKREGKKHIKRAIGKALLSDGEISIWIRINTNRDMKFFEKQKSLKYKFPIGVVIQEKVDTPYGITFNPNCYNIDFFNVHIPDLLMTSLRKIIERSDFYMKNGLFDPPVWFIYVKVERVEKYNRIKDIREEKVYF